MSILQNISDIKKNISDDSTLIAVSKTKAVSQIKEAYDFGLRDFGENKVQELNDKINQLPNDIRWHFIGHLQRNKVKYIVGKVYLIHSLDSVKLLEEIERLYFKEGLIANVLIQINIGKEESKAGIYIEELDNLLQACEKCKNVRVLGLMAIIPKGDKESCRMYFKKLKDIWDELKMRKFNNISMEYLSMGMTEDYDIALSEGSNMIRIGTGIFGNR